ncbi:hypothetical protein OAS14_05765 [Alphaproteobacteria bacterium]|nr:hypothetical protein [Alphaproteobacteria bacterium]
MLHRPSAINAIGQCRPKSAPEKRLQKNGWFDEVVSHMENKKLIPFKWNKESVFADAKRYRTNSE